jgi:anaerobic selenocysteine-containing dehydrogenase
MKEIRRRDFLKLIGGAAAGIAINDLEDLWAVPDEFIDDALKGPGIETFRNSVCQLCPAGCGIKIRLIDGMPVHIDGNPMSPINHGGICPHGAAGLDFLYNPERIRGPLLRMGRRGEGQWKTIGWDEAIVKVVERLRGLRDKHSPEQLAFIVREEWGLMHEMISRFTESFGSRNLLIVDEGRHDFLPYELFFGWKEIPEPDIEHAQFVLSFGANFLEDGVSPVHGIHAYSKMREPENGGRGKLTFVDTRHSLTAANADVYLPIKPGTHGAFALGVAYVLIKERYYNASFVNQCVEGFDSWTDAKGEHHMGFKQHVLESFYPERAASICGVPARSIVKVARDLGRIQPSVAIIGHNGTEGTNGLFNALAVLSLNVLMGNIDKGGGLKLQRNAPVSHLPGVHADEIARSGLENRPLLDDEDDRFPFYADSVITFCDNVQSGQPYPIDTLFIYGANPAFDHPYAKRIRKALDRIPFIVSFATMMDESSEYADIILPDHTFLEKWMDSGATPGVQFAHASVGQPVVKPFYDTRHAGDVLIEIANGVGGSAANAFPKTGFFSLLQDRFHGLFASGEGAVFSGSFEESWVQFLKERGWQNLVYESFDDFWKVLVEQGGWWDPVSEELPLESVIQTKSGKISLVLSELVSKLSTAARNQEVTQPGDEWLDQRLESWGISEKGDTAFLPHYENPLFVGEERDYPYYLITFGVLSNRLGSGSFSPLLQEMFGYYQRIYWDSWIELNPHTAFKHRIKEQDLITVTSVEGTITARVVFNEMLEPHAVAVPFGMGHTSGGRYAKGVGVNPYEILAEVCDPLWGRPAKAATRVRIEKSGRKTS